MATQETSIHTLSIIVPHFANTKLLGRLLSTIPATPNIRTIVVDDCSPLEAQAELDQLETQYPCATFLRLKKNGGGGYARNRGLELADTDYVLFADSDDFFLPTLEWALGKYLNTEQLHDLVFFNAVSLDSDTFAPSKRTKSLAKYYKGSPKEVLHKMKYLFGEPWCKLVRRTLLTEHDIKFEELPIHNDTRFSYQTGFYAKDAIADGATVYCITNRSDSVSKAPSWEKIKLRVKVFSEKKRFLEERGVKAEEFFLATTLIYVAKQKSMRIWKEYRQVCKENQLSTAFPFYNLLRMVVCYIKDRIKQ